jgi:hypothetical protein
MDGDHVIHDWRKGMKVPERIDGGMFDTAVLTASLDLKFRQFISSDSIFDNPGTVGNRPGGWELAQVRPLKMFRFYRNKHKVSRLT